MVMTMMMKIIMMMMVEVRLLVLSLLQRPSSNELTSPKAGDILGNWQWHCRVGPLWIANLAGGSSWIFG